ncbi:MAG: hypothetical protein ABSB71_08895 [Candidatus Bathyarchaeia archaeon]
MRLYDMPKGNPHRTTIVLDEEVWKRLFRYVFEKHGTAKKMSFEIEQAVIEYLDRREK